MEARRGSAKELEHAHVNELQVVQSEGAIDARLHLFTEKQQRKILWRIDTRLVLTLGFMYCVSLMDRTNLGLAAIGGMAVDLVLIDFRYSTITLVFFITYVLLQPAATVVLRRLGPRLFLPSITLLWGITMICFGFLKTWTQMVGLRIVLGIFEAGFFPGCAYLLSCWYPRFELQKRNAVFYLIGSMASAFSGILAYGFLQMDGLGGGPAYLGQKYGPTKADPTAPAGQLPPIAGWRWIFIMEGVITCAIALAGYYLVVDFPEKATTSFGFLTESEAAFVVARIEKDRHDAIPEAFSVKKYLGAALDLKVWGFAWLFGLTTTSTYAIAYFLPIILEEGMGFPLAEAECLVSPPYVAAAILMFAESYYSDKFHMRAHFIFFNGIMSIVGLALLGYCKPSGVRYFGVFLATMANNANVPCVLTYQANNIRGQWKRALCSATLVGAGGLGGIIGSTVFRSQDSPAYKPGIETCIIAGCLILVITALLTFKFQRANKRADGGGKIIEGLPGFRYTI